MRSLGLGPRRWRTSTPWCDVAIDERLVDLAERVLEAIVDEKDKGMKASGLTLNVDDWCAIRLAEHNSPYYQGSIPHNDQPKAGLWGLPVDHSGSVPPGCFIITSVGAG